MFYNDEIKSFQIEGEIYKTLLTKKFSERKNWSKPNPKEIKTVIPGTVIETQVKEGDTVNKGDVLFILEAMKMRNRILAPFDGKIKTIFAINGKALAKGVTMLEFE